MGIHEVKSYLRNPQTTCEISQTLLSVRISMAFFRSKSLIFRWNSCNVSRTAARLVELICWQRKVFFCKTSHFSKMATVVSTSGRFSITSSIPVSWPALATYMVWWKMVCERWFGERWCVKDGVWQSGAWRMVWWKMVWDKVVCERWCVKDGLWRCVRAGVWQSGVKDGVSKMVCQRWCVKDGVWQNEGACLQVPRLPRKTKVDVTWCHQAPCLPRETKVDVTKLNESQCRQVPRLPRKVPRRHRQPIQSKRTAPEVPGLPRETKVDVTKCHACHVKRRWMSPSGTPATQSAAASRASRATKPVQARHPVP